MGYWRRAQGLSVPQMTVGIERADGIVVASIDDGKANALNLEMIAELSFHHYRSEGVLLRRIRIEDHAER